MMSLVSPQFSWYAAVVSGIAWMLSALPALVFSVEGTGETGSASDFFIETTHFIAEAGILFALFGFRARQIQVYGRLGEAGLVLAFLGNALIFLVTLLFVVLLFSGAMTGADIGAQISESLPTTLFISGFVGIALGFPLLGIATMQARVFPWWAGALMIAHPLLFFFSLVNYARWLAVGVLWLGLAAALKPQAMTDPAAS